MDLRAAGLKEQPFRARGKPLVFVGYAGQQKAQEFFEQTAQHNAGLGLFQGPGSGTAVNFPAGTEWVAAGKPSLSYCRPNPAPSLRAMRSRRV